MSEHIHAYASANWSMCVNTGVVFLIGRYNPVHLRVVIKLLCYFKFDCISKSSDGINSLGLVVMTSPSFLVYKYLKLSDAKIFNF